MALGAKGVLLGRAWIYAMAARGEAGIAHVLQLFEAEMKVAMSLTGCTSVREINRDMLVQ
jgi:L-lactate dehydrogenase (cytochrome)